MIIEYVDHMANENQVNITKTTINMIMKRGLFPHVNKYDGDQEWTDKMLYEKYGLTQDEQDYIEAVIKPMEL